MTAGTAHSRRQRIVSLAAVGFATLSQFARWRAVAELVGETLLAAGRLLRGKASMDRDDVWDVIQQSGASSLAVVTLVNLLVGSILAFVGAIQLMKFGAEIFVADLVSIATVREMAAVITAVVLCGRVGAAFAARIATMQGNEEIDALRVMGVKPVEFLVLPRVLALTFMLPVLYVYACGVGLAGGWLVGVGCFWAGWTRAAFYASSSRTFSSTTRPATASRRPRSCRPDTSRPASAIGCKSLRPTAAVSVPSAVKNA